MTKWDMLTDLLKDFNLDELLDTLERRASVNKPEQMKRTILTAAQEWKECKSYHDMKIVKKIIDVILNDNKKNSEGI